MAGKRTQKQGTAVLCSALRLLYDLNIEIVKDRNASPKERAEARAIANRAVQDAARWKCGWADRV